VYGDINMKKPVEQRKNSRLQVTRDALVGLGPDFVRLGQVIDVSMDGLAFRCFGSQEPSKGASELDIFLAGRAFYMRSIPFKTVWDFEMADEVWSGSVTVRRYGVRFGQLTSNQTSLLNYFIENYTTGEA
jgi:hypothetical protein